jgi:imidazoleglycerol phosphate dehydratase HisB
MKRKVIRDGAAAIGPILRAAGRKGLLLESNRYGEFAVLPMDDDLLDYLLEHSPRLIAECEAIRRRMDAGHYKTLEEVKRMFAADLRQYRAGHARGRRAGNPQRKERHRDAAPKARAGRWR